MLNVGKADIGALGVAPGGPPVLWKEAETPFRPQVGDYRGRPEAELASPQHGLGGRRERQGGARAPDQPPARRFNLDRLLGREQSHVDYIAEAGGPVVGVGQDTGEVRAAEDRARRQADKVAEALVEGRAVDREDDRELEHVDGVSTANTPQCGGDT